MQDLTPASARGKFEKFSLDMLITLATRAGKKVELKLAASF
jgi:predicted XRE-type DNA-binding protein